MKKQTFTLLLILLLFLSAGLIAQNNEGQFRLKEGDWFEVQADRHKGMTSFSLRYQLQKELPNKNQQYRITVEHFKITELLYPGVSSKGFKMPYDSKVYLGCDSYYPVFEENKSAPEEKNQFAIEVNSLGKIVSFHPLNNKSWELTEINALHGDMSFRDSYSNLDSVFVYFCTNSLMNPISNPVDRNHILPIGDIQKKQKRYNTN